MYHHYRIQFIGGPEDGGFASFAWGAWAMGQHLELSGIGHNRHVYRIEPKTAGSEVPVLRLLKSYRAETCGGK